MIGTIIEVNIGHFVSKERRYAIITKDEDPYWEIQYLSTGITSIVLKDGRTGKKKFKWKAIE